MNYYGFDGTKVTISSTTTNSSDAGGNCVSLYGDYARVMPTSEIYSALAGLYFGIPSGFSVLHGQLVCGGSLPGMIQLQYGHGTPSILDTHIYACLSGSDGCAPEQLQSTIQSESTTAFNSIAGFINSFGPSGWRGYYPAIYNSPFILGETHTTAIGGGQTCDVINAPTSSAVATKDGFNASSLHGRSVGSIVRPWNNVAQPCYLQPVSMGPYLPQ